MASESTTMAKSGPKPRILLGCWWCNKIHVSKLSVPSSNSIKYPGSRKPQAPVRTSDSPQKCCGRKTWRATVSAHLTNLTISRWHSNSLRKTREKNAPAYTCHKESYDRCTWLLLWVQCATSTMKKCICAKVNLGNITHVVKDLFMMKRNDPLSDPSHLQRQPSLTGLF